MSRRSRNLVGVFSLALILLVVVATALAKPATPKTGVFIGTAEAAGAPGAGKATFKVTRSGKSLGVEVTLSLSLTCQLNGQPIPTPAEFSSASFKQNGGGAPLPVKDGKFSYKGPIYGFSTSPGRAEISGTFKSPTKVVGTASLSWSEVALVPGQSGPCESGKLTLAALHE